MSHEITRRVLIDAIERATRPSFLVGLDLGQAHDYTAWTVAERFDGRDGEPALDVGHIDRIRGARYPDVVRYTADLVNHLREIDHGAVDVLVDYTGVGRPVADLLLDSDMPATIKLVTITAGNEATQPEPGVWHVPKRDLASAVQVMLQGKRIRVAEGLPLARTLTEELTNFRVKINAAGRDSYGAGSEWREGNHDDLVLSLALCCWEAVSQARPGIW